MRAYPAAAAALAFCCAASFAEPGAIPGYEIEAASDSVSYVRADGSGSARLGIMAPVLGLNTTKECAEYAMDRLRGWDLQPVVALRGFSFRYVDNAPCSGLVTYFDGRSSLLFTACGKVAREELDKIWADADARLRLSKRLKRESHPNLLGESPQDPAPKP